MVHVYYDFALQGRRLRVVYREGNTRFRVDNGVFVLRFFFAGEEV
jgi:hypothetical protein